MLKNSVNDDNDDIFVDCEENPPINSSFDDDDDDQEDTISNESIPELPLPAYFNNEKYPLHRAVFEYAPLIFLKQLLKKCDISQKDCHGNTALHLAVMLGHDDHINFLIENGAPIVVKNLKHWSPLDEAISYGNRDVIKKLFTESHKESWEKIAIKKPNIISSLEKIGNFQMEIQWTLRSWIPFVNKFLPSDIIRISKKGSKMRVDTHSFNFENFKWVYGDVTFLFNPFKNKKKDKINENEMEKDNLNDKSNSTSDSSTPPTKSTSSCILLDNDLKCYQYISLKDDKSTNPENSLLDLEQVIDELMSSDLAQLEIKTKEISFQKIRSGWFSKSDKTKKVGQFKADFYKINNFTLIQQKRREHLSDEDIKNNKATIESLKSALELKKDKMKLNKSQEDEEFDDINDRNSNNDSCELHDAYDSDGQHTASTDEPINNQEKDDDWSDDNEWENVKEFQDTLNGIDQRHHQRRPKRESLPPPEKPKVTWKEYITAPEGSPPCLGRMWKMKSNQNTLKATVGMSEEFPISKEAFLDVLEIITPFKNFRKLKEFIELNLPPGFPVEIDLPLIKTLMARVSFIKFKFKDNLDDNLFEIPPDYREDSMG